MESDDTPKSNPDIIWRVLDDGVVLVSPSAGKVRVLNEVGSFVWQLLDGTRTVAQIEQEIAANFDVGSEKAAFDVNNFLEELAAKDLLV